MKKTIIILPARTAGKTARIETGFASDGASTTGPDAFPDAGNLTLDKLLEAKRRLEASMTDPVLAGILIRETLPRYYITVTDPLDGKKYAILSRVGWDRFLDDQRVYTDPIIVGDEETGFRFGCAAHYDPDWFFGVPVYENADDAAREMLKRVADEMQSNRSKRWWTAE